MCWVVKSLLAAFGIATELGVRPTSKRFALLERNPYFTGKSISAN